jgi:type VI secretion system protein ImpB
MRRKAVPERKSHIGLAPRQQALALRRFTMAKEGSQKALGRVRAPRVQITYDLETNGALEKKELPMVVGVLGDFSGKPVEPLPRLKDRKFVSIDKDNFNDVMKGAKPRAQFRVKNTMTEEAKEIPVELTFNSIADFEPEQVVKKVEPLAKLLEARARLSDLRNKIGGNEKLEELLQDVLQNTEKLEAIAREAGVEVPSSNK